MSKENIIVFGTIERMGYIILFLKESDQSENLLKYISLVIEAIFLMKIQLLVTLPLALGKTPVTFINCN